MLDPLILLPCVLGALWARTWREAILAGATIGLIVALILVAIVPLRHPGISYSQVPALGYVLTVVGSVLQGILGTLLWRALWRGAARLMRAPKAPPPPTNGSTS